ncbi:hypothetical protein [Brucepastera parasyntrophica]|uniref:hypothetical protein n=1 Tax=Brucepastera parasyntrophica TaxID=2880008 RepID=UPI0034E1E764
MTVVKTNNLVKDYSLNGITVHALRGVNLGFEAGEFSAIAGPQEAESQLFCTSSDALMRSVQVPFSLRKRI